MKTMNVPECPLLLPKTKQTIDFKQIKSKPHPIEHRCNRKSVTSVFTGFISVCHDSVSINTVQTYSELPRIKRNYFL